MAGKRKNKVASTVLEWTEPDWNLNMPIKDISELSMGYYVEIGDPVPNYHHMIERIELDDWGDEKVISREPEMYPAFSVFRVKDVDLKKREITVMSLRSTFEVPESLLKNVIILPSDRVGSHENIRKVDAHIFYMVPDLTGDYATRDIDDRIKGFIPEVHWQIYREKAECQVSLVLRAINRTYSLKDISGQRYEIRHRLDQYDYSPTVVADIVTKLIMSTIRSFAPDTAMIAPHLLGYRYEITDDPDNEGETIANLVMVIDFKLKFNYEEIGIPHVKWLRG